MSNSLCRNVQFKVHHKGVLYVPPGERAATPGERTVVPLHSTRTHTLCLTLPTSNAGGNVQPRKQIAVPQHSTHTHTHLIPPSPPPLQVEKCSHKEALLVLHSSAQTAALQSASLTPPASSLSHATVNSTAAHVPLPPGHVSLLKRLQLPSTTWVSTKDTGMVRVGQNHIHKYILLFIFIFIRFVYTVYVRYFWQGDHPIYGHIWRIHTVLANPRHSGLRVHTGYRYHCVLRRCR
jgi:hypothetical protein